MDTDAFKINHRWVWGLIVVGVLIVISPAFGHDTGEVSVESGSNQQNVFNNTRRDDTFRSLMADPRALRSHASFVNVTMDDTSPGDFSGAFVGIAGNYPLYRDVDEEDDEHVQVDLSAGILSQFNLDKATNDLLNTDFFVGIPVSYRRNNLSLRMRLMHQSSHLGDEFLLSGEAPERVNLSLEFVDFLLSYDYRDLRVYGGGAYAINRHPDDLERGTWQGGVEYIYSDDVTGGFRPLAGINVTAREETDWSSEVTGRIGARTDRWLPGSTSVAVMLEGFSGPLPFGQFYTVDSEYFGLNLRIEL